MDQCSSTPVRARQPLRRSRRTPLVATLVTALVALGALPALAAGTETTTTWVRAAHLVPGLGAMDFTVTPVQGGEEVELAGEAGYGAVSDYEELPAGEYRVDVRAAGTPDAEAPALSGTFDLAAGAATTLVGVGTTDSPRLATLADDLTTPADGTARVRLLNAAQDSPQVDVSAQDGPVVAEGAVFGQPTDYTEVPAGRWDLRLAGGSAQGSSTVDLEAGGVYTLFVLGQSGEDLTVLPVVDAAAAREAVSGDAPDPAAQDGAGADDGMTAPAGGVDAGAGGTATATGPLLGLGLLLLLGGSAGAVASTRRRTRTS